MQESIIKELDESYEQSRQARGNEKEEKVLKNTESNIKYMQMIMTIFSLQILTINILKKIPHPMKTHHDIRYP